MDNFFSKAQENWTNPSGQLHLYLLPDDGFSVLSEPYLQIARESEICAQQPKNSLHATVQRLPFFANDEQIRSKIPLFGQELRRYFTGWQAPDLLFGLPEVTDDSLLCYSEPTDKWREYTRGVRSCAVSVFGGHAGHFPPVPRAHLTLAYGVAQAPSDALKERVAAQNKEERKHRGSFAPFYAMKIDHVALVTVYQRPEEGIYLFDTIAEFYL